PLPGWRAIPFGGSRGLEPVRISGVPVDPVLAVPGPAAVDDFRPVRGPGVQPGPGAAVLGVRPGGGAQADPLLGGVLPRSTPRGPGPAAGGMGYRSSHRG